MNIKTYIVGGYLRDVILGRILKDIDIMVEGDGVIFAKKLSTKLNIDNLVVYEKFKTALIPHKEIQG